MKSRHEMHVRELNARRVDDEFAALAPEKTARCPTASRIFWWTPAARATRGRRGNPRASFEEGEPFVTSRRSRGACGCSHDDYLETSAAAGRWLPEEDFELRDAGRGGDGHRRRALGLDRDLDEDEDEDENQTTVSARGGDIASTTSPSRLGPPGGRLRVARGAPGVFAGETVRVLSVSEELLVSEAESLLEAAGARVRRGWGVETRRASRAATRRRRSAPVAYQESEAVPDSQEDEDEDDPDPGWWIRKTTVVSRRSPTASPGSERGACASARRTRARGTDGGEDTAPLTAVIMARGVERTSGARRRETMARTRVGLALGVSLGDSQPLAAEGGVFSGRFTRGDARVARVVEGRAEGGTKRVDGGEADGTGSTKGDAPHGRTRHARRWWVPTGGRIVSTVRPRRRARRHRRRSSSTRTRLCQDREHLFTEFSRASRRLWRPSRKSPGRA